MKKTIRIILAPALYIITLVPFACAYSLLGLAPMLGMFSVIVFPFRWLCNDEEAWEDAKDGFLMGTAFIYVPVIFWIKFAIHGKLDLD